MGWYIHTCFWICGPGAAKLIYLLLWSLIQPWLPSYTFDCGKTCMVSILLLISNSILLAETMITHACMVDIWLTFAIVYGCHLIFGATIIMVAILLAQSSFFDFWCKYIWLPSYLNLIGATIYYGCHFTFIFATIKFTCDPWCNYMVAIQCTFDLWCNYAWFPTQRRLYIIAQPSL